MSNALKTLQIARRELGLHDDDYRTILKTTVGVESSRGLSDAQIGRVLDVLKTKHGWTPRVVAGGKVGAKAPKAGRRMADTPTAKKARALWISLYQLGAIRDRSEAALESFGRRQLKIDTLNWADEAQMYRVIEALKAMAERAGWSQDVSGIEPAMQATVLRQRLEALLGRKAEA
jgi:phage gp16-like protein